MENKDQENSNNAQYNLGMDEIELKFLENS